MKLQILGQVFENALTLKLHIFVEAMLDGQMTKELVVDKRLSHVGQLARRLLALVRKYILRDQYVQDGVANKL
jgi:hypothetical protein